MNSIIELRSDEVEYVSGGVLSGSTCTIVTGLLMVGGAAAGSWLGGIPGGIVGVVGGFSLALYACDNLPQVRWTLVW